MESVRAGAWLQEGARCKREQGCRGEHSCNGRGTAVGYAVTVPELTCPFSDTGIKQIPLCLPRSAQACVCQHGC